MSTKFNEELDKLQSERIEPIIYDLARSYLSDDDYATFEQWFALRTAAFQVLKELDLLTNLTLPE